MKNMPGRKKTMMRKKVTTRSPRRRQGRHGWQRHPDGGEVKTSPETRTTHLYAELPTEVRHGT
jgi:hypothetical protein